VRSEREEWAGGAVSGALSPPRGGHLRRGHLTRPVLGARTADLD